MLINLPPIFFTIKQHPVKLTDQLLIIQKALRFFLLRKLDLLYVNINAKNMKKKIREVDDALKSNSFIFVGAIVIIRHLKPWR